MTQVQIDAVRKLKEENVKQLRNKRDFLVPFLRTWLSNFAEQEEDFAVAVMAQDKSLEGCVNALKVPQGDRVSLPDCDVYRMAAQYFFPEADVECSMKISVPAKKQTPAKVLTLNLVDLLGMGGTSRAPSPTGGGGK